MNEYHLSGFRIAYNLAYCNENVLSLHELYYSQYVTALMFPIILSVSILHSILIFPGRTQSLLQPVLYRKQFLQGTPVLTKLQYRLAL